MTNRVANREDSSEPTCDPRLAALLAVHLVSQVLDEAYVIVDAAKESGQPWNYISMLKSVKADGLGEADDDNTSFGASKGDNDVVNENKMDLAANVVATSTPQKVLDDITKLKTEACFIGQGDAELETNQNQLSKSTSMLISNFFDMSDVEQVFICDDNNLSSNLEANDILTKAMTNIMESYVNTALGLTHITDKQSSGVNKLHTTEMSSNADQSEHSAYSFMSDEFKTDFSKVATFNINNDGFYHKIDETYCVNVSEINEQIDQDSNIKSDTDRIGSGDVAFYENYLTLNRDYEQCSDDEGEPVLQDPKGIMLQEIELITINTSNYNSPSIVEPQPQKSKELVATSAISAGASSRKSSIASRCRTQGARLLACLRGWWRRKTPGKRKEARYPGAIRGLCPLSPDVRRRAASLLDHRELRSPSPLRSVVWKFNTVNEALVNSSRWKNYGFDTKYEDIIEY